MSTTTTSDTIQTLKTGSLIYAANVLETNAEVAKQLLGSGSELGYAAEDLRKLVKLKEEDDQRLHEELQQYLAAEQQWKDEVHALTQAIADQLVKGRAGVRYAQAQILLEKFDITPKAAAK